MHTENTGVKIEKKMFVKWKVFHFVMNTNWQETSYDVLLCLVLMRETGDNYLSLYHYLRTISANFCLFDQPLRKKCQ